MFYRLQFAHLVLFAWQALEEMAKSNDGKVTCPRTGAVFNYTQLVKAFIS